MVHSDRLHQVRVVEDQERVGTVISSDIGKSNERTIFPLQAALGWTIAQNLFISERNLLVEGPSELIYLRSLSAMLEAKGRTGLRGDVTIVPAGGLDKLTTFVALLGASGLKIVVLHDYRGNPEQKITDLVKDKLISAKAVLNASQFREAGKPNWSGRSSDIEDLFDEEFYLAKFNETFAEKIGKKLNLADLPAGDRIIERLERLLKTKAIQLRPSGGFNHYLVALTFTAKPPETLDQGTYDRFESLFKTVNSLF
jgi:predicted ATP-dependent endonuclease of OLD family